MTRKPQFTKKELTVLLEEVGTNQIPLFSKLKNTITNSDKKKIWTEITQKINAAGNGNQGFVPTGINNGFVGHFEGRIIAMVTLLYRFKVNL